MTIPVPSGTYLLIDAMGLHYNRMYMIIVQGARAYTAPCSSALLGRPRDIQARPLPGRLAPRCISPLQQRRAIMLGA